jgi:hypothetical protein
LTKHDPLAMHVGMLKLACLPLLAMLAAQSALA